MQDIKPADDDVRVLELATALDRLLVTDRLIRHHAVVQASKLPIRRLPT